MPSALASAGMRVAGGNEAPRFHAQTVTGWTDTAAAMSTPLRLLSALLSVMTAYLVNLYVDAIENRLVCNRLDFTTVFRKSLEEACLTHAALAGRVSVTPGFVSQVATKRSKIPPESISRWADALELTGENREVFVRLAYLEHAPDEARKLVVDLGRELARSRDDLTGLRSDMADLRRENARLLKQIRKIKNDV